MKMIMAVIKPFKLDDVREAVSYTHLDVYETGRVLVDLNEPRRNDLLQPPIRRKLEPVVKEVFARLAVCLLYTSRCV